MEMFVARPLHSLSLIWTPKSLCVLSKCLDIDQHLQSFSSPPGAFGPGLEALDLMDILAMGEDLLSQEPSVLELRGSITLCGAILGDLQHLQNLRHVITAQPGTGLLFLGITWRRRRKTKWRQEDKREVRPLCGDVVLGSYDLLGIQTAFGYCAAQEFGNSSHFRTECIRRYDLKVALRFLRILEWLPLAAVVGSAHLCCLGGIRPLGGLNLKEIQKLGDQNAAAMSMFFRAYDRCLGGVAPSVYGHGGHGGHGGGHGGVASPSPAMRMSPSASSHPEERLLKPWMQFVSLLSALTAAIISLWSLRDPGACVSFTEKQAYAPKQCKALQGYADVPAGITQPSRYVAAPRLGFCYMNCGDTEVRIYAWSLLFGMLLQSLGICLS
ncbi:unnamed protein product [Cladocopium goreaui]|uniref:Serine/threonine-protein phosphatase PP-X homolog 2 n=1 Tax=Cladocopium goreaui TaxID=2562237 RepID=A0A9P1BZI5_9DINO|nr:unnamed protein product [Cladocopium goreaui]